VALEHLLIADVPEEVKKGIERQRLIESVLVLGVHIDIDEEFPPLKEDDQPALAFDPTKEAINSAEVPLVPLGDLRQLQEKETIAIEP